MQFQRTKMLIGENAVNKLKESHVAVFGVGGVGSFCVEALARAGIGTITVVDNDLVNITNINRQLIATHSTLGKYKVECAKERITDINPKAVVNAVTAFYLPENSGEFDFSQYDYIVDAVDTVTAKIELVLNAQKAGVPIISCMGTGNKLDATGFEVTDIYKTQICPLARIMRKELKNRGVKKLKVVYSNEIPKNTTIIENEKRIPASISYVPSAAGLILAGEVIKDLMR